MALEVLYENKDWQWIDVLEPKAEDYQQLREEHQIPQLFLEDMAEANHLPKYEKSEGLHFFLLRESSSPERKLINSISDISTKLGLFVFENKLITVHRMKSDAIESVQRKINETSIDLNPSKLSLQLALGVLESFDKKSIEVVELVDQIGDQIFLSKKNHPHNIRRLYKLKRQTTLNSRVLSSSSLWVSNFAELDLDPSESNNLKDMHQDVTVDFEHLEGQITNQISMLVALSDQKANHVMKMLAIYSMYFLPITFIAGLYGMNFSHMPELSSPYGYIGTLAAMAIITLITYLYVKKKNW